MKDKIEQDELRGLLQAKVVSIKKEVEDIRKIIMATEFRVEDYCNSFSFAIENKDCRQSGYEFKKENLRRLSLDNR